VKRITYNVTLTKEERENLMAIINKGTHNSQWYRSVYFLFNSNRGDDRVTNEEMAQVLKVGMRTIDRIKK
jgi:hypothetical protein